MSEKEYLTEQEHDAYMHDFSDIMHTVIKTIIVLADKHNVDRNNALQHFATIFSTMVQCSTFEHFKENETEP